MPAWKPCKSCLDEAGPPPDTHSAWLSPYISLCQPCGEARRRSLAPILRDRSYRAHLARQILDIPCFASSNCPEHPPGHILLNDSEIDEKKLIKYQFLVNLVVDQFRRSKHTRFFRAFEVLAAHYTPGSFRYCSACVAKAREDSPRKNAAIIICKPCYHRRLSHIDTVHAQQDRFLEPWQNQDVLGNRVHCKERGGFWSGLMDKVIEDSFGGRFCRDCAFVHSKTLAEFVGSTPSIGSVASGLRSWFQAYKHNPEPSGEEGMILLEKKLRKAIWGQLTHPQDCRLPSSMQLLTRQPPNEHTAHEAGTATSDHDDTTLADGEDTAMTDGDVESSEDESVERARRRREHAAHEIEHDGMGMEHDEEHGG